MQYSHGTLHAADSMLTANQHDDRSLELQNTFRAIVLLAHASSGPHSPLNWDP